MEIISRAEAKKQGFKRYFTGNPCKHGHIAEKLIDNSTCVECQKIWRRERYKKNKEKELQKCKEYRENNKEAVLKTQKKCIEAKPEYYKEYLRNWHLQNKERRNAARRARYKENKEAETLQVKKWREENRKFFNQKIQEKRRERSQSDPIYYIKARARDWVQKAFKRQGFTKNSKTQEIIGCSWEKLKEHIESQFKIGMSWENRGQWHVDHIVPLSSAETEQDVVRLCHYKNLQPLWAEDNRAKSDYISDGVRANAEKS